MDNCHWCGRAIEGSADGGRYHPRWKVWLHNFECCNEYARAARQERDRAAMEYLFSPDHESGWNLPASERV